MVEWRKVFFFSRSLNSLNKILKIFSGKSTKLDNKTSKKSDNKTSKKWEPVWIENVNPTTKKLLKEVNPKYTKYMDAKKEYTSAHTGWEETTKSLNEEVGL